MGIFYDSGSKASTKQNSKSWFVDLTKKLGIFALKK